MPTHELTDVVPARCRVGLGTKPWLSQAATSCHPGPSLPPINLCVANDPYEEQTQTPARRMDLPHCGQEIHPIVCLTNTSKAGAVILSCLTLVGLGIKPLKDRICLFKFRLCAELAISMCHSKHFCAA